MKKKHLLLLFLTFPFFCFSQVNEINFNHQNINFSVPPRTSINPMSIKLWDNYNNGGPTSYGTVMEIYGAFGHQTSQLYFGGWDNSRIRYREAFYAQNTWSDWITMLDSKNDIESSGNLKVTGNANSYILNGNVGIGTTNPAVKLDVLSTNVAAFFRSTINVVPVSIINSGSTISTVGFKGSTTSTEYNVRVGADGNDFIAYTNNIERLRVNSNGNLGIGTTTPDSKLTVKGKIHAEEVKVDLAVPADYVFEKYYLGKSALKPDYTLLTLSEVEKFTQANHHLPNVPSATEIKENGLLLGEMSNILLQKVEELTLYSIAQQKTIEKQATAIDNQSIEIERLKKENDSFKKLEQRLIRLEEKR